MEITFKNIISTNWKYEQVVHKIFQVSNYKKICQHSQKKLFKVYSNDSKIILIAEILASANDTISVQIMKTNPNDL